MKDYNKLISLAYDPSAETIRVQRTDLSRIADLGYTCEFQDVPLNSRFAPRSLAYSVLDAAERGANIHVEDNLLRKLGDESPLGVFFSFIRHYER